ncbi:MAG: ABC-2 family transporter protein [Alphaproteobacteria bacterium]|nr:ABC-2 family transporter protein [Alphaproteobacteria bacterium]
MIAGVWALVRASLMTALQYRASFWGEAATALLWTTGALIPLFVVYGQTQGVAGWTWSESLLVMGFFITLEGLLDAFVEPNLRAVVEHVRQGTLDFVLLKPIDAQLHVSLHRTAPTRLTHTVAGLGVVAWAARDLGPSAGDWVAAAVLLASGVAILHAIWTLVICTSFWFVRIDNLSFLLRSVLDAGRWPLGFYRGAVRFALTFLLPVGLMTTFPALALRGALSPAAGGMALGVAAVFVVAARVGWTVALRQYSSASS